MWSAVFFSQSIRKDKEVIEDRTAAQNWVRQIFLKNFCIKMVYNVLTVSEMKIL